MANVYSGGKLVLFEAVNPAIMRSGFVFGLLPGWWLCEFQSLHHESRHMLIAKHARKIGSGAHA